MDIARTVRQCCEWQKGNLGMGNGKWEKQMKEKLEKFALSLV
jgi:hypothetical protein